MELLYKSMFYISAFIIIWAMVGYPLSMKVLGRIFKRCQIEKDYDHEPTVTVMVVAHNEEKVIWEKLQNILALTYPKDKIEFLIASDNSTDRTNALIQQFIEEHPEGNIRLFKATDRKGKTNAQNEAQKTVKTEFLVMTDANSILANDAVKELMAAFTSEDIAYVTGRLSLTNENSSDVSSSEDSYWDSDLAIRNIEGRIQTITAGNGALYACRTDDYYDFDPLRSHDSAMPLFYALKGKRAIANHDAVAYEKASEDIEDEFKRKVRLNRLILKKIIPDIKLLNVFKYQWFSYFYFGHRTCRYLLWLAHLLLFVSNALLLDVHWFYIAIFGGQGVFYALALLKLIFKIDHKYINLIYYYCMTVIAQWAGVYKMLTGQAKPFWDKAESSR